MGYVYSAAWFLMAALLFVKFRKVSKIVYALTAYFVVMGCWWLANEFVSVNLMSGTYGWIFRGISAAFLIVIVVAYLREKRFKAEESEADNKMKKRE